MIRLPRCLLVVGLYLLLTCSPLLFAQPEPVTSSDQTASVQTQNPGTVGREVAHESREADGEDEQAKFKQSASVKLLAKTLHISLEGAYWVGMAVNFAVVAGLVFWFARKSLPTAFRNRTASIQKAMTEASKASEDAQCRLAEIESRLSRLDSEIAGLRAAAEKESAEEEQRIRSAADDDARKIREAAELEIVAAAKTARRQLTAYAADLAVALAAKQLHVDAATDRVLVRNFSQQISAASENPKPSGKAGR